MSAPRAGKRAAPAIKRREMKDRRIKIPLPCPRKNYAEGIVCRDFPEIPGSALLWGLSSEPVVLVHLFSFIKSCLCLVGFGCVSSSLGSLT
jgi:hypothetical protein